MLHLVFDIARDLVFIGWAYGESAVAILPAKLLLTTSKFIDVLACVGFHPSNKVSDRTLGWNSNPEVSVVMKATNFQGMPIQIFDIDSGGSRHRQRVYRPPA